jgi:hypothetical protein
LIANDARTNTAPPRREDGAPILSPRQKIAAQTQKRRFPKEAAFLFEVVKEEFVCPWQAWQRPTLPGLKP